MSRDANTVWARALVDELARSGVSHVCVAPGSRSAPLVLAVAGDDRFRGHVHLDERSAAFFALGVAKASARPAAVITTSGTAVANLLPAVVEASQCEAPLLLLTADRPPRLRGTDANQTIDQVGIFGGYARVSLDLDVPVVEEGALHGLRVRACEAVSAALGPPAGPVHVNVPFDKPLEPDPESGDTPARFEEEFELAWSGRPRGEPFVQAAPARSVARDEDVARAVERVAEARGRVLLVAGPGAEPRRVGPAVRGLARGAGWPLLADALSGARFPVTSAEAATGGSVPVLTHYDLFLREEGQWAELRPELVIRVGAAPTSAALGRCLAGWSGRPAGVPPPTGNVAAASGRENDASGRSFHLVVDQGHRRKDHQGLAHWYLRADPADFLERLAESLGECSRDIVSDPPWTRRWTGVEKRAGGAVSRALEGPLFEGTILAAAVAAAPPDGQLFVGSSMPIRDLDAFGGTRASPLHVVGNRGASGIDGGVSTALGMAAGGAGPVVAVLGDVAFYHDMNGLLAASQQDLRVLFVVIHNDGGGIFHMLPIREHEPAFTPYFATPHGLDFSHAAKLYGIPFTRLTDPGDEPLEFLRGALEEELSRVTSGGGPRIVEVPTDREENQLRHEAVDEAVRAAVRATP